MHGMEETPVLRHVVNFVPSKVGKEILRRYYAQLTCNASSDTLEVKAETLQYAVKSAAQVAAAPISPENDEFSKISRWSVRWERR